MERSSRRSASPSATTESGVPVPIVGGSFLVVFEDFVRFGDFLKLFFRLLIARVLVRVKLNGHLAIRLFQLVLGRLAAHPKQFVVVLFHSLIQFSRRWAQLANLLFGSLSRNNNRGRANESSVKRESPANQLQNGSRLNFVARLGLHRFV